VRIESDGSIEDHWLEASNLLRTPSAAFPYDTNDTPVSRLGDRHGYRIDVFR
jgi:hypothetical protein